MTMMSKVSLGCSFSYFVFYFDFWMSRRLECAIGKDEFFKIIWCFLWCEVYLTLWIIITNF